MADNPWHTVSQLLPFLRIIIYVLEVAVKYRVKIISNGQ